MLTLTLPIIIWILFGFLTFIGFCCLLFVAIGLIKIKQAENKDIDVTYAFSESQTACKCNLCAAKTEMAKIVKSKDAILVEDVEISTSSFEDGIHRY